MGSCLKLQFKPKPKKKGNCEETEHWQSVPGGGKSQVPGRLAAKTQRISPWCLTPPLTPRERT